MYIFRGKLYFGEEAINQEFTVVLYTTVATGELIFSGWQTNVVEGGVGTNRIHAAVSVINDVSEAPTYRTFSFYHDELYHFTARLWDRNFYKLNLLMQRKSDGKEGALGLDLVYHKQPILRGPPVPVVYPHIFVGKINYTDYAESEMFILVTPGIMSDDSDVCAYWQWTSYDGISKLNINAQSMIEASKFTTDGRYFQFFMNPGAYTFKVTYTTDTAKMEITISEPNATSADTLHLVKVANMPATLYVKNMLPGATPLVNNSTEALYCWLQPSGTVQTNQLLLVLLTLKAGLTPPSFLAPSGMFITLSGFVGSAAGADRSSNNAHDIPELLFPGDCWNRALWDATTYDLYILRAKVRDQNKLIILTYGQSAAGGSAVDVKDLVSQTAIWKTLKTIGLSAEQRLVSTRMLVVPCLMPLFTEKEAKDWVGGFSAAEGSMWSVDKKVKWFGSLGFSGFADGHSLFQFDDDTKFGLFQSVRRYESSDDYQILNLPDHTIVLKLNHCRVSTHSEDDSNKNKYALETCADEASVLKNIQEDTGYWTYTWAGDKSRLFGYDKHRCWDVVYSTTTSSVYFPVRNWMPYFGVEPIQDG